MVDFNDIVKKSLAVVNQGFVKARDDLGAVVERIDISLRENAGDHFALLLSEVSSSLKGTIFCIVLDADTFNATATLIPVLHIRIPTSGYPLELGSINRVTELFVDSDQRLASMSEVEAYFVEQLSDPNSVLIQAIGFALRKKMNQ